MTTFLTTSNNLKSTAHFIFEKMDLHDGVFKKSLEVKGAGSFSRFAQHCSGGIASWLPRIELRRSAFSGSFNQSTTKRE